MKNVRPKPDIIFCATVDQGKQLELHAEIDGKDHILLNVSADEQDESRWVGMEYNGNFVQIPLELIKSLVHQAEEEVHSETWYEANVYNQVTDD